MALAFKTDLTQPLLELADRFSCTIEMATYLAMLVVGGPKRFFLWYYGDSWQVKGGETVPAKFRASFALCNDDLELALLLARVWFQSGSTAQARERWARSWQVNHGELIASVERRRNEMLDDLFFRKSDGEYVRPVDLRLMPKVRLLMAYHLVALERLGVAQGSEKTLKGGIYSPAGRQAVPIHQDSVCYGRAKTPFLYFFADSLAEHGAPQAQQVIDIPQSWLNWLRQGERDCYDLAPFLARETRYADRIEVRVSAERRGTFLDHDLSSLFTPFATLNHQNRWHEEVRLAPYYGPGGICGIEPPDDDTFEKYEEGKVYDGVVRRIFPPPHNYALIQFEGGLRGDLHFTDIWGYQRMKDICQDEGVREGKTIRVRIKQIDRKKKHAELSARLPDSNPYRRFRRGGLTPAIVVEVGMRYILLEIDPRIAYIRPTIYDFRVDDMRRYFKVGDRVVAHITNVNPDKEYIEAKVAATD